jgi:hypothetical protein
MRRGRVAIFGLGVAVVAVVAIGLFVWSGILHARYDAILAFILVVVAVITFFGFMSLGRSLGGEWELSSEAMRNAITVSTMTVYFVILALAIFLKPPEEQQPITQTLVTSFTTVVGVVIAFYFGSSAYVQVHSKEQESSREARTQEVELEDAKGS